MMNLHEPFSSEMNQKSKPCLGIWDASHLRLESLPQEGGVCFLQQEVWALWASLAQGKIMEDLSDS